MPTEFAQIIGPLAQSFFGEPNRVYSSEFELRYGSKGSFSVDLRKGTWYDHEAGEGGGALDLVTRETQLTGPERLEWLEDPRLSVRHHRTERREPATVHRRDLRLCR